ncbi:pimeloyl-ACP methyl ester carboxylesterase [Kribbella orskensis]|uniref:Pimeloyl-ACP methyl ester carboxylesterase n=1 Tax=Kribbella orskensis TaxID=2512216 RepID=A0ABY2BES7_9ACTN|nr:pimeloyl-ACP methyl ester carboxylesterase [Kribbella sp. VKM Ac-2500]TCO18293.1 pimeloyl-ACP methyl ester carboxylesterase [Kribbella orskensis]
MYQSGSGSPPVIFVSGLGDGAEVWQAVTSGLTDGRRLVAYDRAGIGNSGQLNPADLRSPQPASWAASQLRALLDELRIEPPFILVGHSVGGQIADAFSIRWPTLVAGLVLVDAVDPTLNLQIEPPRQFLDDAISIRPGQGWIWDVAASAEEYASSAPTFCPPTTVVSSAIWRWFEAEQPALYAPLSLSEVDQRWQLAQLNHARRWQGQLVVAHEAGHRVHQDAPELICEVITATTSAAATGSTPNLDSQRLRRVGGSLRPTSAPSAAGQGASAT